MKSEAIPETTRYQFSVRGAQQCAEQGRLGAWVHAYLNTGEGFHQRLAAWFEREERFWLGPIEVSLSRLTRRYGPEEAMPWKEPREDWERRVTAIQHAFAQPDAMPPMIARAIKDEADEALSFRLLLNDGAHRHEALVRLGVATFWVILRFDSAAQRRAFVSAYRG